MTQTNEKTEWTKGPWNVCRKGACSCKQVWCDDHPIATVEHGDWGDTFPALRRLTGHSSMDATAEPYLEKIVYGSIHPEVAKANALLIAAAPDLYEALVGVVAVADRQTKEFDAARAALSKARGEP